MVNSVDPDQCILQHLILGLHCLLRHVCLNTQGKYGNPLKCPAKLYQMTTFFFVIFQRFDILCEWYLQMLHMKCQALYSLSNNNNIKKNSCDGCFNG